ncbi:MAG: type II secretion system protein [Okeania sp. SIO2F4]|uniref:hormogonium polysaccharide secretion pseudopilin HpsB n=1 Tax=Okeania sp. SIO2F4 TaxID=2607790 RepID=UPI0014292AFD|nr:hormogonium polysaccharide secretion pseudopilin HpsB [Okeania sp. SIO2F4]NES02314.1 type II secretion system protein [Okeania sp. SIO2F4]
MKFKQRLKNNFSSPEAGYTIIESLVAMIMVSALMAAIAPIIAYSVGTRVQARRVELAAQAARSYIDAVRLGQLPAPGGFVTDAEIPASALSDCSPTNENGNPDYCETSPINAALGEFYCVDNDGDDECTPGSLTDMMVHGAVDADTLNDDDDISAGYDLQVRVFRAAAFASSVTLSSAGVPFTVNNSGLATRNGNAERPLFVSKTEIAPTGNSFQNLRDRLD